MKLLRGKGLWVELLVSQLIIAMMLAIWPPAIRSADAARQSKTYLYVVDFIGAGAGQGVPIEVLGLVSDRFSEGMKGAPRIQLVQEGDADTAEKLQAMLAGSRMPADFADEAGRFGDDLRVGHLLFARFENRGRSVALTPILFDVGQSRTARLTTREISNELDGAEEQVDAMVAEVQKALERFPEAALIASGATLAGGAAVAASPAPAPAPTPAPPPPVVAAAPAPVPEPEVAPPPPRPRQAPAPQPAPAVEPDFDIDRSLYFSTDDVAKAQEDSAAEESIAPVYTEPFYQKWWFWTIIGVALAGGAVGTYIGLKPSEPRQDSVVLLPARP